MLLPLRLRIQGFRGFREPMEFCFDQPATLLFGENRSGKSSLLNAVEWCLFGDDCLGKQTGIRERIGWVVANRHLPPLEARVELELANETSSFVVERCLRKAGKKSVISDLRVLLPDGECLAGDAARQRLTRLVGCEFRDFMTTVYQHQEAIRAILTQEPKDRNDAIDRLLGLSVFRNLLDAVARVKAAERQRTMRMQFEGLERRVQTALITREHDMAELRAEAVGAGVPLHQHNEHEALARAAAVKQSLDDFAREMGLTPRKLVLPRTWAELPVFEVAAKQFLTWLRCETPDVKEQQDLFRRQKDLLSLKAELENVRASRDAVGRSARELDLLYGGEQTVSTDRNQVDGTLAEERERLRQVNHRAALVSEAIAYLERAAGGEASAACPLCGHSAPGLLTVLRQQWQENLQSQVATIDARIRSLTDRAEELEVGTGRYRDLNEQQKHLAQKLARCHRNISEHLGRTLCDGDDPFPLLVGELETIGQRERQLQKFVETKHKQLEPIEEDLHRLRLVHGLLHSEEKKQVLEKIQASPAYRELESVRDQVADWVTDLEAIQIAVADVSHKEAGAKLRAAERSIDAYFRALTRHPAVQQIRLRLGDARGLRNSYDITDQDGMDLTPVLSQGDLNGLALAMFLGLAAASEDTGTLGFVMLDDPSQSLGSEHKKQLVRVLDDVAQRKRLLLATMDWELRALLTANLTKAKTEYAFGMWSPEIGPTVTRG